MKRPVTTALIALPLSIACALCPAVASAQYQPGARTLNDPILPQVGNGGYDAKHYDIDLTFDPAANHFDEAVTSMRARATQHLSEFSMDFQLDVESVTVDGQPATFTQEDSTPDLGPDPITQPRKLIITPARGISRNREFTVRIDYGDTSPQVFTDPDESIEGWIPACYMATTQVCDSFFVVGEPMGSQAWFPSNNHPSDKATIDTAITVPTGQSAFGVGELTSPPTDNGDGTVTWSWSEDDPTATYLATASNGTFNYSESSTFELPTERTLPFYGAFDPSATTAQATAIQASINRHENVMNYFAQRYGPYPFDSNGGIWDRAPNVGYALEVQTKSHYSSLNVNNGTVAHEISHQWFGNAVGPATWSEIWFNEGWAQLSAWNWAFDGATSNTSPGQQFAANYAGADSDAKWDLPPATLNGDPANLFITFPTYTRGAMTLEGYRQIVGNARFYRVTRELQKQFAYGTITTEQFIEFATTKSGFTGARRERLRAYFQQWLYGTDRPQITPATF